MGRIDLCCSVSIGVWFNGVVFELTFQSKKSNAIAKYEQIYKLYMDNKYSMSTKLYYKPLTFNINAVCGQGEFQTLQQKEILHGLYGSHSLFDMKLKYNDLLQTLQNRKIKKLFALGDKAAVKQAISDNH